MISFPAAPENTKPDELGVKALVAVINNIMRGKTNNRGEVTLLAGQTTTTIEDQNIGGESIILLMPLTANAAAAMPSTHIATSKKLATLTHANNAQVDRSFRYAVIG